MRHKTMIIERIRPWVQGKKVLILGFGREGKSTWNVLKKLDCCSFVDVADMAEAKEKPEGIRFTERRNCLSISFLTISLPKAVRQIQSFPVFSFSVNSPKNDSSFHSDRSAIRIFSEHRSHSGKTSSLTSPKSMRIS